MKYEIVIYWSVEDGLYIAEVPDLPGCMTHGATYTEAAENAQEAMTLWLDMAKEFGDPIPEPRQRVLSA
jgi:predicted RNase H-like HicB family nuclease